MKKIFYCSFFIAIMLLFSSNIVGQNHDDYLKQDVDRMELGYCVPENNDRTTMLSNGPHDVRRRIETITVAGAQQNGESAPFSFTLNNATSQPTVYLDNTSSVLHVTKGDELIFSWTFRNNADIEWMHYYLYIDYDHDGLFDIDDELVSYTFFNAIADAQWGENSKGETVKHDVGGNSMPSFVIPEHALDGETRARLKVDWNHKDPCGNQGPTNLINENAGSIVDFTIDINAKVEDLSYSVTYDELEHALMVLKNGDELVTSGAVLPASTELTVEVTPETNWHVKAIKVNDEVIKGNTFVLVENTVVTVELVNGYIVAYEVEGGGSLGVSVFGGDILSSGDVVSSDKIVMVTVNPDIGYELTALLVNDEDRTEEYKSSGVLGIMDIGEDLYILAKFTRKGFKVRYDDALGGTVDVNKASGEWILPESKVDPNTEIVISLYPNDGYVVKSLKVNGVEKKDELDDNNKLTLRVIEDIDIVALFAEEEPEPTYAISCEIKGNGKVIIRDKKGNIYENGVKEIPLSADIVLEFVPESGYVLSGCKLFFVDDLMDRVKDNILEYGVQNSVQDLSFEITFGLITSIDKEEVDEIRICFEVGKLYVRGVLSGTRVTIYNVSGELIAVVDESEIDISDWTNGCYLVKVESNKATKVFKFVK